jgi:hypothetical protein
MDYLIVKYLDKNYKMSIDDYYDGCVSSRGRLKTFIVTELIAEVQVIFSLSKEETFKVVNDWWDSKEIQYIDAELKAIKLQNDGREPSKL